MTIKEQQIQELRAKLAQLEAIPEPPPQPLPNPRDNQVRYDFQRLRLTQKP